MNTVKLITEANDFSTSNYIIEQTEDGKKDYKINNRGWIVICTNNSNGWFKIRKNI